MAESRPRFAGRPWLIAIGLVGAVFASYWPVWQAGFIWDDKLLVDKNPLVTGRFNLATVWFRTDFPISLVAFWAQWKLWGLNPLGYHLANLLVHACDTLILWQLLLRLRIQGAWFGAMSFAVHPVTAESVIWISELKNTLSLLFFLLSAWSYFAFEDAAKNGTPRPRLTAWYLASLLGFLLALLSKTTTVMLPIVLAIAAWWRRGCFTRRDVLRLLPFCALSLSFGLLTIWFQKAHAIGSVVVQTESFFGRLALACRAVWFYLGKAILPLNLSMIYPRWNARGSAGLLGISVAALVVAFVAVWQIRARTGRWPLAALASYVVLLIPALGIINMYWLVLTRVSDHFQYLALTIVAAVAGAAWARLPTAIARGAVAAVVLGSLAGLTMKRAQVMAHEESLWRDTLARNPAAWTAHNNLGCLLAEKNDLPGAVQHFEAALSLNPQNAQAHSNLGRALALQGRQADAEQQFAEALRLKPNDADILRSYASILAQRGATSEALEHLAKALEFEPAPTVRMEYAALLLGAHRYREAAAQYRAALATRDDYVEAANNLAWLLATCSDSSVRDGTEAVRWAQQACRLAGSADPLPRGTLAAALAEAGRFPEAITAAETAISLANAAGDAQFASLNRQLLGLYRAGRPYHEPQPNPPQSP